jgi:hypothetical protein
MSKRRRTNPGNKFVMIERWFWRSAAWQALPHPARSLYVELELLYTGANNGELYLSARDAAKLLHTGKDQAWAAFKALELGGFIRATRKGARTRRGEQRLATSWCLTKHDNDLTGAKATADFMLQKNQTVPSAGTDRPFCGDGTPPQTPENRPERPRSRDGKGDSEGTTVPGAGTHLIYHSIGNQSERPEADAAPPSAGPCTSNPLRGPSASSKFGPWLETEARRRKVPPDYVAAALGVTVDLLRHMTQGRVQWATSQRRKAEAALATYRPNGRAP